MSDDSPRKRGSNAKRRRGARQKAMQALYQWDFDQASNAPDQVIRQFRDMQNMDKVDVDYFEGLFNYAVENRLRSTLKLVCTSTVTLRSLIR